MTDRWLTFHETLLSLLGQGVSFTDKSTGETETVQALVRDDLVTQGDYAQIAEPVLSVSFLREEVGVPSRGDEVEYQDKTYEVDGILEDNSDQYVVTCLLVES